jgi:hypothetical protein
VPRRVVRFFVLVAPRRVKHKLLLRVRFSRVRVLHAGHARVESHRGGKQNLSIRVVFLYSLREYIYIKAKKERGGEEERGSKRSVVRVVVRV